ncbi:MAG: lipoyl(octanoyl) transferase LipB [Kofleriaceae bacterium]|nr:lipoyl(octanoyl) transferase LipB [Kofleriaceae bacterium]
MNDLLVEDLGLRGYREMWELQIERVNARQLDACPDSVLLVEHPHVITLGRAQKAQGNVLAAGDVEVVAVERGGDVTYHGPGQLVAYPILKLGEGEKDLHRFLRNLEQAVILTCEEVGLAVGREPGKTGVWTATTPARKLCSIGIACRKWVTFHGLALNVSTDLSYFFRINPCGFDSAVMTTVAQELGVGIAMADIKTSLARHLGTTLGRRIVRA